jgi:hypothetical protein
MIDRVPFEVAISDKQLLKPRWDTLSLPQQVVLKAFYGLKLTDEELIYWSIFQGGATYNELFEPTQVKLVDYTPREYNRLVAILGRRSGKTDQIISTAAAYEITLGGHAQYVKPNQEFKALFLAQTAPDAQKNMHFIRLALEESPLLSKQLTPNQVASEIRLKNGLIVDAAPANKAVGRGHAIPVVILDEAAFWYTDANAANPDFEVLRAVSYAQLQFPHAKIFIPSTPWAEQGILYQAYQAGTEGRKSLCQKCKLTNELVCNHHTPDKTRYKNTLVVHASTAAMKNPLITRKRLIEIRNEDPEAFPRESGAQFIKSISGWLNPNKIELAVLNAPSVRAAVTPKGNPGLVTYPTYVATIDPGFRKDSFAFTIVHHDYKVGLVQDYIQYWEPLPNEPLKPGDILDEIKPILTLYGLNEVYSDQYQLESLQQLALDRGFSINGYDFTGKSKGKIAGGFKVLLDQERLKLLDHEIQKQQLFRLQRKVLQTGNVQIAAPIGEHDDLAMVLLLASRIAMWLFAAEPPKVKDESNIEINHVKIGLEQIERNKYLNELDNEW